uniref:Uncharacterized protein n=1 Tax=Nelumbo nucifera TaxID=4432 RepID=A0A822YDX4_NELNU|nr:TPA_asm: hypothetical protein HUJ06_031179 [Nelumbo nucifera]
MHISGLQDHLKAKQFRTADCPMWPELCDIYGDTTVVGGITLSTAQGDVKTNHEEADEDSDKASFVDGLESVPMTLLHDSTQDLPTINDGCI